MTLKTIYILTAMAFWVVSAALSAEQAIQQIKTVREDLVESIVPKNPNHGKFISEIDEMCAPVLEQKLRPIVVPKDLPTFKIIQIPAISLLKQCIPDPCIIPDHSTQLFERLRHMEIAIVYNGISAMIRLVENRKLFAVNIPDSIISQAPESLMERFRDIGNVSAERFKLEMAYILLTQYLDKGAKFYRWDEFCNTYYQATHRILPWMLLDMLDSKLCPHLPIVRKESPVKMQNISSLSVGMGKVGLIIPCHLYMIISDILERE